MAIQTRYRPVMEVEANLGNGLLDMKITQAVQGIINYQVIEKTKNYTVLRIKSFYNLPPKRRF